MLYRHVHSIHHEWRSPFAFTTQVRLAAQAAQRSSGMQLTRIYDEEFPAMHDFEMHSQRDYDGHIMITDLHGLHGLLPCVCATQLNDSTCILWNSWRRVHFRSRCVARVRGPTTRPCATNVRHVCIQNVLGALAYRRRLWWGRIR